MRTEADLLRTLATGTYTVHDLYALADDAGLADRAGGRKVIQDGKEQYKRRVRSALQQLKREGRASRVSPGEWIVEGTTTRPTRALLIVLPSDPSQVELVLGEAAEILRTAGEPIDLIVADPPWALDRGSEAWIAKYGRAYGRDQSKVMPGYVDVDPAEYAEFTEFWMRAAADALRPGGYLAVVTGAQLAARIQVIGEDHAGLTYVNSVAVRRAFGMYATRRFVHSHNTVTLLTKGNLDSDRRFFARPVEMPRGRNGEVYAMDVWDDIPEERRAGELRYDNALHPTLVSRLVRSTTKERELVADPFLGSGTTAVVCMRTQRRFYGGDLNPHSLRFAMGRVLTEESGVLNFA